MVISDIWFPYKCKRKAVGREEHLAGKGLQGIDMERYYDNSAKL